MPPSANFRNQLLNTLLPEDLALLTPLLEPVKLEVRALLEPMDGPIEHVFFVEDGVTSVVAKSRRDQQIEVGMIGRDGMSGLAVLLGDDRSGNETFVQVAGDALRVDTKALLQAMAQSTTLHPALLRFAHTFLLQISQTALANGHFKLEERLARWLLMVHDRIDGDRLELTHEFLSIMLGVRRPGVTLALHVLEGKGVIRSRRTLVQIIDRIGLEELSNGCYGVPESHYQRIMGE